VQVGCHMYMKAAWGVSAAFQSAAICLGTSKQWPAGGIAASMTGLYRLCCGSSACRGALSVLYADRTVQAKGAWWCSECIVCCARILHSVRLYVAGIGTWPYIQSAEARWKLYVRGSHHSDYCESNRIKLEALAATRGDYVAAAQVR
jgi:hypothetical protein